MAKLVFNRTLFDENYDNRWKFLEPIEAKGNVPAPGFFMNSPTPVLVSTACYILFVCFIGPLFMRNREPYQLKSTIRFYNLIMVLLAAYLVTNLYDAVGSITDLFDPTKIFNLEDESSTKVYQIGNLILSVRISEYLDTVFFTLRKKQNQVTFLHVFHHTYVPLYAYWILRTAPVRFNTFAILVNSGIHVMMYFYYFLATFQQREEPGKPKKKHGIIMFVVMKLLMFKKYMTQMQIYQFVAIGSYAIYGMILDSKAGVTWTYITANLSLAVIFLSLFVHFYLSMYSRRPTSRADANKKE